MRFRKLSARPRHHAQDKEAAADFKKTSPPSWTKLPQKRLAASRWKSGFRCYEGGQPVRWSESETTEPPHMQMQSTINIDPVIYSAIELSASTWLVASKLPTSEKIGSNGGGRFQSIASLDCGSAEESGDKIGRGSGRPELFRSRTRRLLAASASCGTWCDQPCSGANEQAPKPIGSMHRGYCASWPPTPQGRPSRNSLASLQCPPTGSSKRYPR